MKQLVADRREDSSLSSLVPVDAPGMTQVLCRCRAAFLTMEMTWRCSLCSYHQSKTSGLLQGAASYLPPSRSTHGYRMVSAPQSKILLIGGLWENKMKGKNKVTHFSKVVAVCPSQSAVGASGSIVKMLWTPHCLPAGGFWREEGTSGLGHWGSASLQTHSGRQEQKQWLEAFGRGPEGKKILSSQQLHGPLHWGCSHMPAAPKWGVWKDHTHQGDCYSQNQKSPAHVIRPHLRQTLSKGIESLFRNAKGTRAPRQRCPRLPPGTAPWWLLLGDGDMSDGMHWAGEGRGRDEAKGGQAAETTHQMLFSLDLQERSTGGKGAELGCSKRKSS